MYSKADTTPLHVPSALLTPFNLTLIRPELWKHSSLQEQSGYIRKMIVGLQWNRKNVEVRTLNRSGHCNTLSYNMSSRLKQQSCSVPLLWISRLRCFLLSPGRRLGLQGSSGKETIVSSGRNSTQNASIVRRNPWVDKKHCRSVCSVYASAYGTVPRTSPRPAIRGGSCCCCRAQ